MRVTATSYFNNIYGENNKLNRQLFDVNKQISSGQKIQYGHENPGILIDTLRLDDEITTLTQVKKSVENAYKFSAQTDAVLGEIVKALETTKVKLLHAANEIHSDTSLQAIAKELRGLQANFVSLANSSIGGKFLFSGSATSIKPIAADGTYQGNDQNLQAFMGSNVKQNYNITGSQLFLGEESVINRTVTTNLAQKSLIDNTTISATSTIRDLMGDNDTDASNDAARSSYFYVQGTRTDGTAFKSTIAMGMNETVNDLMHNIAVAYDSNQAAPMGDQITISLNASGQIQIVDKLNGSSKLDFHMVGAVDFSGLGLASVTDIDALQLGTNDFPTAIATPGLFVKEFNRSGLTTPAGTLNTIEGINYDRTNFIQNGAKLISNISQILKSDNGFATPSTKLIDVAGTDPLTNTLTGTTLNLQGKNINGQLFDLQINLAAPSTVTGTVGAAPITAFKIYNADSTRTATSANDVTYQQLMDVVNMTVSGSLPTGDTALQYDSAIIAANGKGSTTFDYAGRLVFQDKTSTSTLASLALYDNSSDTYPPSDTTTNTGPVMVFNANNTLTVRDPKSDFFTQLEQIIKALEEGKYRADGSDPIDPRNAGIQNSIQMIDDLSDRTIRTQTQAGMYSQTLLATSERTEMFISSTKVLQSEVIDTDLAEASLRMQQLSLNYQAMLSSISKVSQLSLVNYL